ncbi:exonuclease II Exo2 [Stygiomarasmius scandens]|uniref:5'-3' exoribonuclease 1 n=1 Tax=Marasmiellus scandens TaxID=2682957 RepID=A0ABR1JUH5_9AGAR
MGIPKFFRWLSERYPLTSQLIEENKIPEFDNLYLDFNSIIHNCSHPNDADAHFRLSEEQIFTSIFTYVDHLFGKIRPKKLFFMAIDGVAPRAKMNQQRSRRFRTAKEAREVREKAEAKGEKLPEEKAFDSNCITPGTPFMARLSDQLKYFVNKKITEDSNWRDITVILSGHDVPGEGEHKIMEYIRLARMQPDWDPDVRHCLYGLDADLIMLGLLSHDPHFCLLREEVKFGPSRKSKNASLESMNFYLLHLCLLREYLDLEFHSLADTLPFPYSLERVIDDFILLAVFVGNDFLPHLPDLHIHEHGLERLFEVYKKALPIMKGYINDAGTINLERLQVILDQMAAWEQEVFEREYGDLNWFKGKQAKHVKAAENAINGRKQFALLPSQKELFDQVKEYVMQPGKSREKEPLKMPNTFPARDRKFLTTLAGDLNMDVAWDEYDEDGNNLVTLLPALSLEDSDESEDEIAEAESRDAIFRVVKKYESAPVTGEPGEGDVDERNRQKMDEWKRDYYRGKLEISYDDPEAMRKLIYRYVEGLQFVMYYYFKGVPSWGWFFDYHYAPRISDLDLRGKAGMDLSEPIEFELGDPFRPYEQLMGVLPIASKDHIPRAYHDLMTNPVSPINHFYPSDFEQDLNGKKQDWEAIVKIPFIDAELLRNCMKTKEHLLAQEEVQRNQFGKTIRFHYTGPEHATTYPSSLPGFFPPIYRCTCRMEDFELPTVVPGTPLPLVGRVSQADPSSGLLAGFPSLKTLPHINVVLGYHHVNVHGTESRNQSVVINIKNKYETLKPEQVASKFLGKVVHTGWPFLREGKVVGVSDSLFKYDKVAFAGKEKAVSTPHAPNAIGHWKSKAERIEDLYSKRAGVVTGDVEIMLHVRPLKGLKRLETGAFIKDYEDANKEIEQALQMIVEEVHAEDPRYIEKPAAPLSEEFPSGSNIFFLGEHAYGVAAQVSETTENTLSVILAFFPSEKDENAQFKEIVSQRKSANYYPSFRVADMLGMTGRALSKITSSFMVLTSDHTKNNLGLSLKFEAKSLKVIDYSKKDGRAWEFSEKAIELIREYKEKFPEIFRCLDRAGDAMATAADIFSGSDPDGRVREIKSWLKSKGVRDFEPVSLFCDQLSKDTVSEIEKLADSFISNKSPKAIKKAIVKNIPRQAVLKPAHAVYRLQNQHFALGDRVTMVQDSGGVPLSAKGVVIGLNSKSMDVVWDVPFMSGTTMGDRCSQYRGCTVEFNTCLNLSYPQFVTSTNPDAPPAPPTNTSPFKPKFGPYPLVNPAPGQAPAAGFRSAPRGNSTPVHIMTNPHRGRGGIFVRGGGGHNNHHRGGSADASHAPVTNANDNSHSEIDNSSHVNGANGTNHHHNYAPRGAPRGRGVYNPSFAHRGRGGFLFDRGRGAPQRGFRGRGRGGFTAPLQS